MARGGGREHASAASPWRSHFSATRSEHDERHRQYLPDLICSDKTWGALLACVCALGNICDVASMGSRLTVSPLAQRRAPRAHAGRARARVFEWLLLC